MSTANGKPSTLTAGSLIGERILLTLWVGSLWAIGYIAAPTLFSVLEGDRQLAGELAGRLFTVTAYVGLVCGALLLAGATARGALRSWRAALVGIMVALTAIGQFGITPLMGELRSGGLAAGSEQAARFGMLHGISSTLFLVTSLLGLALVAFGLRSGRTD